MSIVFWLDSGFTSKSAQWVLSHLFLTSSFRGLMMRMTLSLLIDKINTPELNLKESKK